MNSKQIIDTLWEQGVLESKDAEFEPLSGGTMSSIGIIRGGCSNPLVIKVNDPEVTKVEADFLTLYKSISILPELVYRDEENRYIVYPFLQGKTDGKGTVKTDILRSLVFNLLNHFKRVEEVKGWGYVNELHDNREKFFENEVRFVKEIMSPEELFPGDFELVEEIVKKQSQTNGFSTFYHIHGDCGFHNFVFLNDQLSGVIDPQAFIGHPLYDLVFAFCSSPEDLTKETILGAAENLNTWDGNEQLLYEEVLLGLFIRLARCKLHHPKDLSVYLNAWKEWKRIVNAG
jgi:fructosamine-3-kinase